MVMDRGKEERGLGVGGQSGGGIRTSVIVSTIKIKLKNYHKKRF